LTGFSTWIGWLRWVLYHKLPQLIREDQDVKNFWKFNPIVAAYLYHLFNKGKTEELVQETRKTRLCESRVLTDIDYPLDHPLISLFIKTLKGEDDKTVTASEVTPESITTYNNPQYQSVLPRVAHLITDKEYVQTLLTRLEETKRSIL
jgi:hypothetical protein